MELKEHCLLANISVDEEKKTGLKDFLENKEELLRYTIYFSETLNSQLFVCFYYYKIEMSGMTFSKRGSM